MKILALAARYKARLAATCFLVLLASANAPVVANLYQRQEGTGGDPATNQAAPLAISSASLPDGRVGQPYSLTLQHTGGTGPFRWELVGGPLLPDGLRLDKSTGKISGTPTVAVRSNFAVYLTDHGSPRQTATANLSLTIAVKLRKSWIAPGDVKRAPPGKSFPIEITFPPGQVPKQEEFGFSVIFWKDKDKTKGGALADAVITKDEKKSEGHVFTIMAQVPEYREIFEEVRFRDWLTTRSAHVEVKLSGEIQPDEATLFEFEVPLRRSGTFWGIAVLLVLLLIVRIWNPNPFPLDTRFDGGGKDKRAQKWRELHPSRLVRALLAPLNFAVTPIGNYSISLTQILFWTAVVIFASVYVFVVRGEFLHITDQMLGLLGLSAATALGAKANAVIRSREIPDEYFVGLDRTRVPRLRDLISIGGVPSIFKFQIMAFTLINGIVVLRLLYAEFNFPEIPAGQLTLMGISGATYLGNEMAGKNVWKDLEKMVDDAKSKKGTPEYDALKTRIQRELREIYS